jgi:hypothetical protein
MSGPIRPLGKHIRNGFPYFGCSWYGDAKQDDTAVGGHPESPNQLAEVLVKRDPDAGFGERALQYNSIRATWRVRSDPRYIVSSGA